MLLWRHSEPNNFLFIKLLGVSVIAHMILGFLLFVVYQGSANSFHVTVGGHTHHRPVLFTTPKRRVCAAHSLNRSRSKRARGTAKNNRVGHCVSDTKQSGSDFTLQNKTRVASETTFVQDKRPVTSKREQKKLTATQKKSNIVSGTNNKQKVSDLKNKQEITKNEKDKKHASGKEIIVTKKQIIEPKKIPQVQQACQQPIEQKPIVQSTLPVVQEQQALPVNASVEQNGQCSHNVSTNVTEEQEESFDTCEPQVDTNDDEDIDDNSEYVSAEVARMQYVIERELIAHWKPPKGLAKDLECQIKVRFGGEGKVIDCVLEKKSGVLIYDMAARTAAKAMILPRWAWGKDFVIAFKQ